MRQTVSLVGHLSCPPMSATATLQARNPSPFRRWLLPRLPALLGFLTWLYLLIVSWGRLD